MPARILVIEDDGPSGELVCYLLAQAGHVASLTSDGRAGLEKAIAENPDLVLCDLQLPQMDGYEIAQALLATDGWRRVPLIAVTALSMRGDRERCLAAGFDGYITKPITPETFVREIEEFLPAAQRTAGNP